LRDFTFCKKALVKWYTLESGIQTLMALLEETNNYINHGCISILSYV